MFSIIGILVVFGAVIGGFLMEKGNLAVLVQPAEILTIVGAALGTLLAANPAYILKGLASGLTGVSGGSKFPKQRYLDTLKMMFDLFTKARREGLVSIEGDIEEADKSELFKKYPIFVKDHHARDFVCDTMRMAVTGGVSTFDVDHIMEMELLRMEEEEESAALVWEAAGGYAPTIGILGAVLGLIQVMQKLDDIGLVGRGIAVAFVATLYGVGLANLVFLPMAGRLRLHAREMHMLRQTTLEGVLAIVEGASPRTLREKLGAKGRERTPAEVAPIQAAR